MFTWADFRRTSGGGGWVMSPVFDINPNPDLRTVRHTTFGGATNPLDEVETLVAWANVSLGTDRTTGGSLCIVAGESTVTAEHTFHAFTNRQIGRIVH